MACWAAVDLSGLTPARLSLRRAEVGWSSMAWDDHPPAANHRSASRVAIRSWLSRCGGWLASQAGQDVSWAGLVDPRSAPGAGAGIAEQHDRARLAASRASENAAFPPWPCRADRCPIYGQDLRPTNVHRVVPGRGDCRPPAQRRAWWRAGPSLVALPGGDSGRCRRRSA